ncbi:hypothetical protein [Rheinheimera sp. 1928-s]|uniref:hypothetical protein n=1 Tax=Rheinheimera sp. 1928-s TaxID=3033803 RepID=UPI0026128A1D|nr:hypothetical protein [Rheinheimera sp. 1928-s]MDF3126450.1 hypothetical protein [Rheinheimera sp. 1928-s]
MNIKIYHRLVLIFGLCFLVGNAEANTTPLRECVAGACSEIVHNKELGKATVTVWDEKGNVISADTFDLDSSAELVHVSTSDSVDSTTPEHAPAAPCDKGPCATAISQTYETATHVVTVTYTFIYFNGQLMDVNATSVENSLPLAMTR